ncbi:hypothetical protein PVAND_015249 [Polypedilum vanderplanki]|uniref:Uncharacterized protein n=1 Tax=Polypedilum vanderplanki TaxID=319348 RepID=A0A9J6BC27_POLVA|nr:hypothetical protein PVAND_015249 [Polypedilum vanderplanki]
MKDVKFLLGVFAFLISLAVFATKESSEETPYYECENKFSQYHLDNEPAEYGLAAGFYAPGKKAYVGVTCWNYVALNIARIQLDPLGAVSPSTGGPSMFYNDSHLIWYLRKNRHHQYKWIDSWQKVTVVPFAIKL